MTDKELRYLKRIDLLDIMIAQDKEIEQLKRRLEETEKRANLAEAVIQRFLAGEQDAAGTASAENAASPETAETLPPEAEQTAEPVQEQTAEPVQEQTAESMMEQATESAQEQVPDQAAAEEAAVSAGGPEETV